MCLVGVYHVMIIFWDKNHREMNIIRVLNNFEVNRTILKFLDYQLSYEHSRLFVLRRSLGADFCILEFKKVRILDFDNKAIVKQPYHRQFKNKFRAQLVCYKIFHIFIVEVNT